LGEAIENEGAKIRGKQCEQQKATRFVGAAFWQKGSASGDAVVIWDFG